jgi:arginine N-succinyltransferase
MNIRFLIRSAERHDLESLMRLAPQALLVNLPPDEDILAIKIARSLQAFSANPPPSAEYLFVLEDVASGEVVGTSLIIARYATPQRPHYFFEVHDTSRGQELTLGVRTGGLSAIGGLVLDRRYRGMSEKRGKQISLIRFVFMGMQPQRFEPTVLSELMTPVAPDGSNRFWDALGGRFTGMRYAEAFALTRQKSRDFIPRHFPAAPICLQPTAAVCNATGTRCWSRANRSSASWRRSASATAGGWTPWTGRCTTKHPWRRSAS